MTMDMNAAAGPIWAREEVVRYSPSAAISWQNNAGARPVTLVEHDSILVGLLALRDFVARPDRAAITLGATLRTRPYATVLWRDPVVPDAYQAEITRARMTAGLPTDGMLTRIPVVGIYPRPADATAARWYDALTALVQRIADLTQEEAAPSSAAEVPADAIPVAVYGDLTELTVTMPGRQFREDPQTVVATLPMVAGATAYVEQRAGVARAAGAPSAETQIAAAIPVRDALARELVDVGARGNMRAWISAAVVVGGAYFLGR